MAQSKSFASLYKPSATAALLGFLLMALAAFFGALHNGVSDSWASAHQLLANAAMYLSPALLGVAACLCISTRRWSRPAWGRLILGVCAVFEMSRWYGLEVIFRDLQLAIFLTMAMYLLLRTSLEPKAQWLMMGACAAYFTGALVIGTHGTLAGYLREGLFHYLVGLGNLLLGSGLYMILKNHYPSHNPELSSGQN